VMIFIRRGFTLATTDNDGITFVRDLLLP